MASNRLIIRLDLTPPVIEVIMPSYGVLNRLMEIRVQANEELDSIYSFHIIDSQNVQRDYVLDHFGDYLIGSIDLQDYPVGQATAYIKVRDIAYNESEDSKVFPVLKFIKFKLQAQETRAFAVAVSERAPSVSVRERGVFTESSVKETGPGIQGGEKIAKVSGGEG